MYLTGLHLDRALDGAKDKGVLAETEESRSKPAIGCEQPREGIMHGIPRQHHHLGGQTSYQGGALNCTIHNAKKSCAVDGLAPARRIAEVAADRQLCLQGARHAGGFVALRLNDEQWC